MLAADADVVAIYEKQGPRAAYDALRRFVERPRGAWGKKPVRDLERYAVVFYNNSVWPLAVVCWLSLLWVLRAGGEEERRAYFFNDLGTAFLLCLDARCFACFSRALRLTRSPGRRMRTLRRIGRALAIVNGDFQRARRFLTAALWVGERYRLNEKTIAWISEELAHLKPSLEAMRRRLEREIDPCLVDMLKDVDPAKL